MMSIQSECVRSTSYLSHLSLLLLRGNCKSPETFKGDGRAFEAPAEDVSESARSTALSIRAPNSLEHKEGG